MTMSIHKWTTVGLQIVWCAVAKHCVVLLQSIWHPVTKYEVCATTVSGVSLQVIQYSIMVTHHYKVAGVLLQISKLYSYYNLLCIF